MALKYKSLKKKVVEYQDHCRNKEQKYRDRIHQTQEECRSRLLQVKTKTKDAFTAKELQVTINIYFSMLLS